MASALELNAASTIINGAGLAASTSILSKITQYQSLSTIAAMSAAFTAASGNIEAIGSLAAIGSGVTKGHYLIDSYPGNVVPACTGSIYYYGIIDLPIYNSADPPVIVGFTTINVPGTEGVSYTLANQANGPFTGSSPVAKLQCFANVYQKAAGFASSEFDTISSITMLEGKTYKQSGLGYTNSQDVATGGLGRSAVLIANVVSHWGTMYDVHNFSTFSNVYVFGQNLLNQGLGSYGNLSQQFTNAGLNVTDITKPPAPVTITTQTSTSISTTTSVGLVELPSVGETTTTIAPTGASPAVMANIYQSVTGSNLTAIISATGISNTTLSKLVTLNDYLDFNKVITPTQLTQLGLVGIKSFSQLAAYFKAKLSQTSFTSWAAMSSFLTSLDIPTQTYTSTNANAAVLAPGTVSTLTESLKLVTGSGPFKNPIMSDFLGAATGTGPYTDAIGVIISSYPTVSGPTANALTALSSAVTAFIAGTIDISAVDSGVLAVNAALNGIPDSKAHLAAQDAWYRSLNKLTLEVSLLNSADYKTFAPGSAAILKGFATGITSSAADKDQIKTYDVIMGIITADAAGDVIRAAISESINRSKLQSVGIVSSSDPQPSMAIIQAKNQNIPISTYLKQNK